MMENLLEARSGSGFPTNGAGPDEDVNVFLAGLLTGFLQGDHDPEVVFGAEAILLPPGKHLSRREQAQYYLANANHRLLYLGLMNRGDGFRRRRVPWGMNETTVKQRDMGVGSCCYRLAVNLLQGRGIVPEAVVSVLEKLADNFEDYVQVLTVMATRHLGLGAQLSTSDLDGLLNFSEEYRYEESPPRLFPPDHPAVDQLLDLILKYSANPSAKLEKELLQAASNAGADGEKILSGLCKT